MNTSHLDIIAEIKLKSPSHGPFKIPNLEKQIRAYERGGAAMISVVTEAERFGGSLELLKKIRTLTHLPILRKDFLTKEKEFDETLASGAACVLLIAREHTQKRLLELCTYALSIGLEVLVELREEKDFAVIPHLQKKVKIGINNRDLTTFKTDAHYAQKLIDTIPADRYRIVESGIKSAEDLEPYRGRANAVLIGTALLDAKNPEKLLKTFTAANMVKKERTGYFGDYGGLFVPEMLIEPLKEVSDAFDAAKRDPAFKDALNVLLKKYAGRPTPLYLAKNLSEELGFNLYLKREDLLHGGAHKTNNTLGQGLLAQRMGKTELIAETGAGQHGAAVAMIGALLDIKVKIFMGARDIERQQINVQRMKLFGAEIVSVTSGSKTLKDSINEALRYYVSHFKDAYYVFGTVAGPHPFPTIVTYFQKIIGKEARAQILKETGKLPDIVTACVGGGSNAMGIFSAFKKDRGVKLVGVEPFGGATLNNGSPAIVHGSRSYCLQDADGNILESQSIAAGVDYPGVGPEHSFMQDTLRTQYVKATDDEAVTAFRVLSKREGIIPALESSHALAYALRLKGKLPRTATVLVNLSGRGDKDLDTVISYPSLS